MRGRARSPRTTAVPTPPPWGGVGTASSNKYGSRGRSCAVVRAWSVVRGRARSCVVGRARSCVRGRSCVVVRGRSCAVVRAWSVVRGRPRSCRSAHFAASTAVTRTNERTNERTTSNNPLNPPGVGWVNLFYFFKVRVSIRTCVPNLGSFRRPCRKCCLSNL